MPMSLDFEERLFPRLPEIYEYFGEQPFHIYDEKGILETGERLKNAFAYVPGFQEFYAVKACPNPSILELMHRMGFGFDCSSEPELILARSADAQPKDIMFTSNNTTDREFDVAFAEGGCILNLDDISFLPKIGDRMPELICFRLNPGKLKTGDEVNKIIGNPYDAKYGVPYEQIVAAYAAAKKLGAKKFGLHTMVCSNSKNHVHMVKTIELLLKVAGQLDDALDIQMEFLNMGGGIGIQYNPYEDSIFDIEALGRECARLVSDFRLVRGWSPALVMESGRWMTGPHGVLVNKAINRKDGYHQHIGVQVAMPALMRHAIYGAYHHVTVLDSAGSPRTGTTERVNIVGPICENCDRLATDRVLPIIEKNDFIITHDTGAHGIAMGFNYNGRTRPMELMLRSDGSVVMIRRAEEIEDLWATLQFTPLMLESSELAQTV